MTDISAVDKGISGTTRPAWLRIRARLQYGIDIAASLEAERARWFMWLPVLFGLGIVVYFRLPSEPGLAVALAAPVAALALKAVWRGSLAATVVTGALLAASFGFAAAKARTEWTRAPVLERRIGPAEVRGHVVLVEPKATRGQRITLAVTSIAGVAPEALPRRVRIRAMRGLDGLAPGHAIRIRATLSPPGAPPLPGGYDFARTAWFAGLGAVGHALAPPEIDDDAEAASLLLRWTAAVERIRQGIGARIVAAVPGETGAIANSLITGERGAITEKTTDAFRDSGLIHILSISGLHMAIMAGTVFMLLRALAALAPSLALRFAVKKHAAAGAALAAFGYLLISGSSVATVRAFIMISIVFLAVVLDRPALAMRNVALAALAILVMMPESVLDAGFQMSFAAVVSLVAAYEAARGDTEGERGLRAMGSLTFFLGGIVLTTLIASFAVAPFGAYHFHRSQQYAVLANLVAIPICNFVIMPAALLTLVAMPAGLESYPLAFMAWGIEGMVWTAERVAALPGSVVAIPAMSDAALGLMIAGGLWLTLWRTGWRWLGLAAIALGVAVAPLRNAPDVLVGGRGVLVAMRGEHGRLALLSARRGAFDLKRWLEHDGDARTAAEAAAGRAFRCDGTGCTARVKGLNLAVVRHASAFQDDCARADILLAAMPAAKDCTLPRAIIDTRALRRHGAHALYVQNDGTIRIETVAAARGNRPWAGHRTGVARQLFDRQAVRFEE